MQSPSPIGLLLFGVGALRPAPHTCGLFSRCGDPTSVFCWKAQVGAEPPVVFCLRNSRRLLGPLCSLSGESFVARTARISLMRPQLSVSVWVPGLGQGRGGGSLS